MAEEQQVEQTSEQVVEQQQEVQVSDVEKQAIEQGWRPKDQFEGEEHKWVPADEFLRRGELFTKIDSMGKELRDTKKALQALQNHHKIVKETEYKRAIESLKAEKKQALEAGDADKLIEIDDQIAEAKAAQIVEQRVTEQAAKAPDPRFVAWVEKNSWYAQDAELRAMADEVGSSYSRVYPDKDPEEILQYVATRVKKAFPEKFQNPNRKRPSAVEGDGGLPPNKKDTLEMSEEEVKVMKTFVRQGVMTEEEYKSELKRTKGIA